METTTPNPLYFLGAAYRRQLDLELQATRGRSTWGARRPGRPWRLFSGLSRA